MHLHPIVATSFTLACALTLGCTQPLIPTPTTVEAPRLSNVDRNQQAAVAVVYSFKNDQGPARIQTSGVAVSSRYVLTSLPVYVRSKRTDDISIYGFGADGSTFERLTEVESVLINESNLLILLKTKQPLLHWVAFGEPRTPVAGDRLYSTDLHNYAGPAVLLGAIHTGIVSHTHKNEDGTVPPFLAEVDVTVTSPGCGVYDLKGGFIGLLVTPLLSKDGGPGSGAVVIPASTVVAFLDANGIPYQKAE